MNLADLEPRACRRCGMQVRPKRRTTRFHRWVTVWLHADGGEECKAVVSS